MWTKLKQNILAIHFRLLPDERGAGWLPYFWLVYLGLFFQAWFKRPPDALETALSIPAVIAFLALYFRGFWLRGRDILKVILGILILGIALLPINPGALTFFIYAASFCGRFGPPRRGLMLLLVVLAVTLAAMWLIAGSTAPLIPTAVFVLLVGCVNIYFYDMGRKDARLRLSQDEVQRLSTAAERERIAHDLHDLLGQTLSVISLKSQLAGKLVDRNPQRAAEEILQVAQISRDALKQMRQAVQGYRESDLAGELAAARLAMEAMDIRFTYEIEEVTLDGQHQHIPALILREAVTNVLRHSGATTCHVSIRFDRQQTKLFMTIRDNGRGGSFVAGTGLTGMQKRVTEAGGTLDISSDSGFQINAALPMTSEQVQKQLGLQGSTP